MAFPGFTLTLAVANLLFFIMGMLFLATASLTQEHFTGGAALTSHASFAQVLAGTPYLPVPPRTSPYLHPSMPFPRLPRQCAR